MSDEPGAATRGEADQAGHPRVARTPPPEITYASRQGKRIVPLQIAPIDPADVPLELADLHLLDTAEPGSYRKAIQDVVRLMQEEERGRPM